MARGAHRVRRSIVDLKDEVMGNDEAAYPWQEADKGIGETMTETRERVSDRVTDMAERATEKIHDAEEAVSEVPELVRRKTTGNPLAAGLIAFGGGLLIASVFGPTSAERKAARGAQPVVEEAMREAKDTGREMAEGMKESAQQAAEDVKDEARQAGERIREGATEAARAATEKARP